MERVTGGEEGLGLEAYGRMVQWYKHTTPMNLQTRISASMKPEAVKKDTELAGAIERWEKEQREIGKLDKQAILPEPMKKNALISMLTGEVKKHIMWWHKDDTPYSALRGEVMTWAMDRRMESREGNKDTD